VTRTLSKARSLSGDQRRAVERARRLAAAADQGPDAVAGLLGCPSETKTVYPYAFGSAVAQLRDLLAVVDELAPAQPTTDTAGGVPMTALHSYIPDGLVEVAPLGGYCPPEVRQEAFVAVLEGVETGAYDRRIVEWLAQLDDSTCRTIASLMWRCLVAGAGDSARLRSAHGR
jgi:hypothetical protein